LEARFQRDLAALRDKAELDRQQLNAESNMAKNNLEKVKRVLIDKESDLISHQDLVAELEAKLKDQTSRSELAEAKLKTLEQYTSNLQTKFEKLEESEKEKSEALAELLQNDLTQKVLEYKNQLLELRETLKVKEREKEIYLNHLNMSSTDPRYGAKLLEQQSD
jgi:hypothetical protein